MKWRPKGWRNPFENVFTSTGGRHKDDHWRERNAYESGADAMLHCLRSMGKECDGISPLHYSPDGRVGRLVFIPEEEVKDDI